MIRLSWITATLATGLSFAACTAAADPVSWRQYDNQCAIRDVPNEFLCGDYGRFYINGDSALPGCTLIAQGNDSSPPYHVVRNVEHFPVIPVPVGSRVGQTSTAGLSATELHVPDAGLRRDRTVPWLALIDFKGGHGLSVEWLARTIAGEPAASSALLLDDPAVSSSGAVTDIDVLRQLCKVVHTADNAGHLIPVVNMSFGRALEPGDPVNGAPCDNSALACQISQLAEHLRANGAILVAAAGKQKSWLFPAALDAVIGAALMDPSGFAQSSQTVPTWDMPGGTRALMPGNSLCLRGGWPAPSGASYSSAILSGWLTFAMSRGFRLPSSDLSTLVPVRSAARGCHVLGNADGAEYTGCNEYIDELFAGIEGEFSALCWNKADEVSTVNVSLKPQSSTQPETLGVVEWDAEVRPAPEGDPCVPCTNSNFARGSNTADLTINLSSTLPMRDELVLESLHLRADDQFYELELSDGMLEDFRKGQVDWLVIEDGTSVTEDAYSTSLFFRLRDAAAASCTDLVNGQPACGWMATHIHRLR